MRLSRGFTSSEGQILHWAEVHSSLKVGLEAQRAEGWQREENVLDYLWVCVQVQLLPAACLRKGSYGLQHAQAIHVLMTMTCVSESASLATSP